VLAVWNTRGHLECGIHFRCGRARIGRHTDEHLQCGRLAGVRVDLRLDEGGARARTSTSPPGAIPLTPVLLPIAVPYYLLATRQRWHKILALCFVTGYIGIALALLSLGNQDSAPRCVALGCLERP